MSCTKNIGNKDRRRKDFFQGGGNNDEISFYPLGTKTTTLFPKSLIGK